MSLVCGYNVSSLFEPSSQSKPTSSNWPRFLADLDWGLKMSVRCSRHRFGIRLRFDIRSKLGNTGLEQTGTLIDEAQLPKGTSYDSLGRLRVRSTAKERLENRMDWSARIPACQNTAGILHLLKMLFYVLPLFFKYLPCFPLFILIA